MTGIRCGRCIAGDHENCVVSLRMGPVKAEYTWRCHCQCQEQRAGLHAAPSAPGR